MRATDPRRFRPFRRLALRAPADSFVHQPPIVCTKPPASTIKTALCRPQTLRITSAQTGPRAEGRGSLPGKYTEFALACRGLWRVPRNDPRRAPDAFD